MSAWAKFRRWRRTRPFWGGLFLLLSAVELYFSGNLSLKNFQIHIGQQGFLIYLLPAIMLLCGVLVWVTPAQRLFYGIIGLLTALYSFLGLNLGGFFFGMLFGILGGALVIAWGPPKAPPPAAPDDETFDDSPTAADEPESPPYDPGPGSDTALVRPYATAPEHRSYAEDPPTEFLPGFPDQPEPPSPPGDGGVHRKAFVITLVPLLLAAGGLALGRATPAKADPACPHGMPSASATPSRTPAKAPAEKPAKAPAAKSDATPTPTPTPSASASGTGNPLLDGWNGLVDGLGHLLGIGPGDDASPSPTPGPSGSAAPPAAVTPAPGAPGGTTTKPAPAASGPASASPSTPPAVPCLGARQLGKKASASGLDEASLRGGLLEGSKLTMLNSTYDGVVDLPTAEGSIRVLKFTMTSAVTEPFKLTIPEAGGHTTVINSSKLTIKTNDKAPKRVEFYTSRFQGNLIILGLPIPVVFTPDMPPPLTLPKLVFTDVKINLVYVNSQILTAADLKIDEG